MYTQVTAIIIAKNEEEMLANCIESVRWCDEVIVINNESSDATVGIANRAGARVVTMSGSFAELRNEGIKRAKTDWLLYIDADERVTPALAQEICQVVAKPQYPAYAVSRSNILYGQLLTHGGWQNDKVVRLFARHQLQGWRGVVHEEALYQGETGLLHQPLIHFTHRSVLQGLLKTSEWTPKEARLLVEAGVAPVTVFTLWRKGLMELWRRLVRQGGYRDGVVGWIEALTQAINRVLVYMQVWELQQKPSLPDRYRHHEEQLFQLWQQNSATKIEQPDS